MRKRRAALAAVAAAPFGSSLTAAAPAEAADTLEVQAGAEFLESAGIPGFSSRFYRG